MCEVSPNSVDNLVGNSVGGGNGHCGKK